MKIVWTVASLAVFVFLSACGWLDTSPSGNLNGSSFVFLPQGDQITVGKQGFVVKDGSGALLYEGSVSAMENRFYRLTVEKTNRPQDVSEGANLFVLPIEGTLLAIFPGYTAVSGATYATFMEIKKPLSVGGTYPTSTATYLSRVRPQPNLTRDSFLYGQGRISQGSDSYLQFETRMVPLGMDFSDPPAYTVLLSGCKPSGSNAANGTGGTMYFTPSGAVLVKTSENPMDPTYYLLPDSGTTLTSGDIVGDGIEYRGWVEFPAPDPAAGKLSQPIAFAGNGASLVGGPYTKFGQNEVDATRTITIDRSPQAPAGVFDISLNTREGYPAQTRRIVAAKVNGRIILLGLGDRDGNNDGDFDDPSDWITSFLVQMN